MYLVFWKQLCNISNSIPTQISMQLHALGLYDVLQYLSIIVYGRHCPCTSLPTWIDCNILWCGMHHSRFYRPIQYFAIFSSTMAKLEHKSHYEPWQKIHLYIATFLHSPITHAGSLVKAPHCMPLISTKHRHPALIPLTTHTSNDIEIQ